MDFNFFPKVGLGPITFGMKREKVRNILGSDFSEFKKTYFSEGITDAFDDLGIYVYYDKKDTCEAIEVFKPTDVVFKNNRLLNVNFQEASSFLKTCDPDTKEEGNETLSLTLGISLCSNDADEEGALVDVLLVFNEEYFE